jgi:long-subunit fatty acid transport protein
MKPQRLALVIAAALASVTPAAFALTDEETNAALQFNFANPGARSLGIGGAFIGLADDATAAYTNPAGLTQLVQFEVGAEFRHNQYDAEFAAGGSAAFSPFSAAGVTTANAESIKNGLSYFSVVFPMDRWSLALYRHEFLDYETTYITDFIPISGSPGNIGAAAYGAQLDVYGVNIGGSVAYRFNDQLSLGAGLIYSTLDIDSVTIRPFGAPQFATTQTGEDRGFGYNLGALYKYSDKLQFGVVYRDGAELEYTANAIDRDGTLTGFPKRDVAFNVPDAFGIGVSYRVSDALGFTFDVNHMQYSDLTDDFRSSLAADSVAASTAGIDGLGIDDGTEIRFGAEYTFIDMQNPFTIRAGIWLDPEHTIRWNGPVSNVAQAINATLFSTGDDELHYALGFGWAFKHWQLDAAADFSDRVNTISMSGVVRWD